MITCNVQFYLKGYLLKSYKISGELQINNDYHINKHVTYLKIMLIIIIYVLSAGYIT